MRSFTGKKNILWDFDGVLIDSHSVREEGFCRVLSAYPGSQVHQLLEYHRQNSGLSRYVKFRYFFEKIRKESVSEKKIREMAAAFSRIMRQKLINKEVLIEDSYQFVGANFELFNMHIVSGSDQEELRFLCKELDVQGYFITIEGSPTPKKELVKNLISKFEYDPSKTILIGDSINDYEAAAENLIEFYGYNNPSLIGKGTEYINSFQE